MAVHRPASPSKSARALVELPVTAWPMAAPMPPRTMPTSPPTAPHHAAWAGSTGWSLAPVPGPRAPRPTPVEPLRPLVWSGGWVWSASWEGAGQGIVVHWSEPHCWTSRADWLAGGLAGGSEPSRGPQPGGLCVTITYESTVSGLPTGAKGLLVR